MASRSASTRAATEHLDRLVHEHQVGLWRYLRYLGCEPDLAEDIVQKTFVTAWEKPFEVRTPAATGAWLRTVARNHFRMAVRKARAEPRFTDLEQADAIWVQRMGTDHGDGLMEALHACLGTLTARARRALDVFYGESASRRRVGEVLELTEQGVKTLLRRIRSHLRECIRRRTA